MFLKLAVQRTALENQLEALDLVFSKVKQTTVTQLLLETFDLGGGNSNIFQNFTPIFEKKMNQPSFEDDIFVYKWVGNKPPH